MTLQPFEYQRRTNIEEHNQMVEKINEIVDTINDNGLATDLPERVSELEQNAVTQDNRLTSETTARENMDTQLGRRIDTAFNNIIAFDGRITANETEITGLKTGVDSLNTEMGGLSTEIGNIETEFNRYASKIRAVNGLHFTYNAGLTSANIDFTVEVECPESADPTAYRVCILEDPVGLLGKDVAKSITDFQIVHMATTEANVRTFKGRIVYDPSKLPEAYDTTFTNPTAIAVPSGLFSQDCWPNMTRMLNTESGGSGGFTPWVETISATVPTNTMFKVGDLFIGQVSVRLSRANEVYRAEIPTANEAITIPVYKISTFTTYETSLFAVLNIYDLTVGGNKRFPIEIANNGNAILNGNTKVLDSSTGETLETISVFGRGIHDFFSYFDQSGKLRISGYSNCILYDSSGVIVGFKSNAESVSQFTDGYIIHMS